MPTGTVKDQGDPGNMKGVCLGRIEPDDSPKDLIPFDNHRRFVRETKVSYVIENVGGQDFALNVKQVHP